MECPKCNKSIEEGSAECSFCGIVIAKYTPDEYFSPGIRTSEPAEPQTSAKTPYIKISFIVIGILPRGDLTV